MASFYLLSLFLSLTHAHRIIVQWEQDTTALVGTTVHELMLYGVTVGNRVSDGPLRITPGTEEASPHFQLTYTGTSKKSKVNDKDREFAFIGSKDQSDAIAADKIKFVKHLKASGKASKSLSKTYTLTEFADMIATGKVQYKASPRKDYERLGAAEIDFGTVGMNVEIDDVFDPNKPELYALFAEQIKADWSAENLDFYVKVCAMQKMVGEDDQKSEMTDIYDDSIVLADKYKDTDRSEINIAQTLVARFTTAKDNSWTNADGEFIGTGIKADGSDDKENIWNLAKAEVKNLMKGNSLKNLKTKEKFKNWVKNSGEYQLRYNVDFKVPAVGDKAKQSMNNAMDDDDEYANNFDAELKLAFVRGYKAGLDAKQEREYGAGLLRKKYRY